MVDSAIQESKTKVKAGERINSKDSYIQQLRTDNPTMGAQGSKDKKIPPEQLSELIQLTHFEKKELKKWYQGFIRDCPDRTMNQEQFVELYSRFYSQGNADKFATHVFRTFDNNNDGSIGKNNIFLMSCRISLK